MMNFKQSVAALVALVTLGFAGPGHAQSAQKEDFTQSTTVNNWYYYNGACLTAGTGVGTGAPGVTAGVIPSCTSIFASYYQKANDKDPVLDGGYNGAACGVFGCTNTLPDPVGQGALRFTNGYPYGHNENGAIVSALPFNSGQGVQITFKTVTYRGDSGGTGADGADGMSFYLIDATKFPANPTASAIWNGLGSFGGSLGYTCSNSNSPYNGLVGGYLGLGIDEYGNFLNQGDNTATGYGYVPKRIGLRGAGSVSWAYLNATYPTYYPTTTLNTSSLQAAAVQKTCSTGAVWNYSGSATNPTSVSNPSPALLDYAPIPAANAVVGNIAGEYSTGVYGRQSATPIQYNLKITQNGLLTLSYSTGGAYSNILSGFNIASGNTPLPSSLYFGFAGSSGGATNIHEILCFKAAPPDQSATSATTDQQLAAKVSSNAQVYFSYYDPSDWTGRLTANALIDTAGVVTVNTSATWDAQCVLSGGTGCATTGATTTTPATAPTSRIMLTWNGNDTATTPGTAGIPFEWPGTTGITTAEQNVLDAGDALPYNSKRLSYLRGDTTNQINSSGVGLFRARDAILGDIVDSSPTWVGAPQFPYTQVWKDRYVSGDPTPENIGQSYAAFVTAEQSRLNVVYTGANDGFLHAFRTGIEDSTGALVPAQAALNDGAEILAYMPGLVLQNIHNASNPLLDPTNPQYAHNFFVDAPGGTGDLYYGGAWHTWLVGGLGPGGAAIYALDITDPTGSASGTTAFSEANAAALVKGEWSSATITCANTTATNAAVCGNSLGNTYGTPVIRRFHNGTWGAIFGNGYGSATGDAGIFVMSLDPTTGKPTFYYLSAGVSTGVLGTGTFAFGNDGISFVTAADLDGDHITDYVYAGDLLGNVWRFDLTAALPANWGVSGGGASKNGAMFSTPNQQPITTPVTVASGYINGSGNNPGILISFGTGQRTQFTATTPVVYASGAQNIYTVLDWNFSTWNTNSAAQYASLTSAQVATVAKVATPYTLTYKNLQAETLAVSSSGIDASNTAFTWVQCTSASVCNAGLFGWYVNLPGSSEQIVSPITLFQQALIVNSTIPATNAVLSCSQNIDTGYTYVLSVLGGGSFTTTTTTTTTNNGKTTAVVKNNTASGFSNSNGDTALVGEATNLTGGLTVLTTAENTTYYVGQGITPLSNSTSSSTVTGGLNLPNNTTINRQTWVQLR